MNETFERDLARFEAGEIDLAELERLHPGAGELGRLHGALRALASEPVPDSAASWWGLRRALPERRRGLFLRARHPALVAALAAALLSGTAIAYASGTEPVRRAVDRAVDWLTGDDGAPAPQPGTESGVQSPRADDDREGREGPVGADEPDDEPDGPDEADAPDEPDGPDEPDADDVARCGADWDGDHSGEGHCGDDSDDIDAPDEPDDD